MRARWTCERVSKVSARRQKPENQGIHAWCDEVFFFPYSLMVIILSGGLLQDYNISELFLKQVKPLRSLVQYTVSQDALSPDYACGFLSYFIQDCLIKTSAESSSFKIITTFYHSLSSSPIPFLHSTRHYSELLESRWRHCLGVCSI